MSSENVSETLSYVTDIESAEKLLHEHDLETTTCFVMYYSYGVGKGKPKVRGAPQMNSGYERECCVKGCRGIGVMGRPRGEGIQKLSIVAFHKNCILNLLYLLTLRECRNWKKWSRVKKKN